MTEGALWLPGTLLLGPGALVDTHANDQATTGNDMAAGHDIPSDGTAELIAHEKSYSLFTGLMKWGTIISLVVGLFVVFVVIA